MKNKILNLFCAFSLCFFYSTPFSYSDNNDNSPGFERLDEGAVNSRAVAFNSSEAASILSNFKEKKAEQVNELRNHVNVYSPVISNVEHSNLSKKEKNNLELNNLQDKVEESLNNPVSEEIHQNLPHEVIMDLPESLPKENFKENKKTDEGTNLRTQKIEGLISDSVHFDAHEDGDFDSHTNLRDLNSRKSSYEKESSESPSFSEAHFSSHSSNEAVNSYSGQIHSSTNSLFIAESAPLILHLENQELHAENSDLSNITTPSQEETESVSEEQDNPSLESEVQGNENSLALTPKIVPEEIIPEADAEQIEEYIIPGTPDFSEGVGAFLRTVSEEGFFFTGMSPESPEESGDFTDLEEASAQCLENPVDAACQDLFVVFISQPLLLKSNPSNEQDGILFENLIGEENDSLMMEAALIPEGTDSDSFSLLSSGDNASSQSNANQNSKKGADSGKNGKNASASGETAAQINAQGNGIEVPLGMPEFYLPWKKAVLNDSKFVKIDVPSVQKAENESFSKTQARVAPESSLNSVMTKFTSEDAGKDSKKTPENNPLDMDFNFPLKSIFDHPIPAAFPIKAIIPPQRIQVSPISSYPVQEVPTEWEIYGWFFEFCTDLYYYDWNWMLWLTQEENRFLRKLDN